MCERNPFSGICIIKALETISAFFHRKIFSWQKTPRGGWIYLTHYSESSHLQNGQSSFVSPPVWWHHVHPLPSAGIPSIFQHPPIPTTTNETLKPHLLSPSTSLCFCPFPILHLPPYPEFNCFQSNMPPPPPLLPVLRSRSRVRGHRSSVNPSCPSTLQWLSSPPPSPPSLLPASGLASPCPLCPFILTMTMDTNQQASREIDCVKVQTLLASTNLLPAEANDTDFHFCMDPCKFELT